MNPKLIVWGTTQEQLNNLTLREWLRRAGLQPNEVEFKCLDKEAIPPQKVPWLSLGNDALRTLTGLQLPIHKVRGSLFPTFRSGWLVATIDPANVEFPKAQDELRPLLGADAQRALTCPTPQIPNVTFLDTPDKLPSTPGAGQIVSVDIEGANGKPNIVGVSWEEEVAYVFPWSDALRSWLSSLFNSGVIPTFHNASYDVAELQEAGVTPPKLWYDTIVMAALYDPEQPMNLQWQVLTHVAGSVAWKGLVDHEKGPDYEGGTVSLWRELWKKTLRLVRQDHPNDGQSWYSRYNALDTAWGLALANNLKRKLESQGRWAYYTDVLMPLQAPLLAIGNRGMPCDEVRLAEHRVDCGEKVGKVTEFLVLAGQDMMAGRIAGIEAAIATLDEEKAAERAQGARAFSKTKERGKLLTKLRPKKVTSKAGTVRVKDPNVFDPGSNPQRCELLYSWYGLPPVKNRGAKGYTTDEDAINDLISRLERGTVKPKRSSKDELLPVLRAMQEVNELNTLLNNFLRPELR